MSIFLSIVVQMKVIIITFIKVLTISWLPNFIEEDSLGCYNELTYEMPSHGNVSWNLNTWGVAGSDAELGESFAGLN